VISPESGLLVHTVIPCFNFWGTSILFLILNLTVHLEIAHQNQRSPHNSTNILQKGIWGRLLPRGLRLKLPPSLYIWKSTWEAAQRAVTQDPHFRG
jgi:hypothetical protein